MQRIAILGSTGSIGVNTLSVAGSFPDKFRVVALSANSNTGLLARQIREFKPEFACAGDTAGAARLKRAFGNRLKVFAGAEGLEELAAQSRINKVVLAVSGSAGLLPLLKAIDCKKDIALANKEALVMAGPLIIKSAQKNKVRLIPIDSEQSAIWQCLEGKNRQEVKGVYLTASGGPFRKTSREKLRAISVRRALRHPRWKMGRKVSVDSATLMNKGLELLEAIFLFGLPAKNIKVLIHPQAIIHSMVEFIDGVILAQLSAADMRIPIQYALSYPERLANTSWRSAVDFCKLRRLDFEAPDFSRFPCLRLAYRVAGEPGTAPAVLNAANEVAVSEFLRERIKFTSIPAVIEKVLSRHRNKADADLKDILSADSWARQEACRVIARE